MLKYSPPKSKLWGHQVSRRTATEVLTLCQQFVKEFCILRPPPPFEVEPSQLMLMWPPSCEAQIAALIADIQALLGDPDATNSLPLGAPMQIQTWKICEEQLVAVAALYDQHAAIFQKGKINFVAMGNWFFTWRNDPSPDPLGGHLACYITSPLTVGTHFGFRDFKHYEQIQQHFQQVGLLELSEKNLTPKALVKEYYSKKH